MSDLKEIIRKYAIKNDRKIKQVSEPLLRAFGISVFSHVEITHDGHISIFSNQPEFLDYYYAYQLYLEDPLYCHSSLLYSGQTLFPEFYSSPALQGFSKYFGLQHIFLIVRRDETKVECSYFSTRTSDRTPLSVFFNYNVLLREFIRHFKKETRFLHQRMQGEDFSLWQILGQCPTKEGWSCKKDADAKVAQFLKTVRPLSFREQQCLELFKQGRSAQATGAILGISQRTVETYFENIKNKLGIQSKAELLEW